MTNHAHTPETGPAHATLAEASTPPSDLEYLDFEGHLGRTLHMTLEQHNAYVALERLIERHGFHEILDDTALICRTLRCAPEHWHDTIAPAVVPVLEREQEEAA